MRNRSIIAILLVSVSVLAAVVLQESMARRASVPEFRPAGPAVAGRIQRLDPRFDALIPADARLESISDGHTWIEGPVWVRSRASRASLSMAAIARPGMATTGFTEGLGHLLFTDIPRNQVLQWIPGKGTRVFLEKSGYGGTAPFRGKEPGANGLALDPHGRLVLAEHGDRRISRLDTDGRHRTLADRYQGRRLNSPNDVVYDSKGNLYFTDPPFGLPDTFNDPARELIFCGVYRLSPSGKLALLTGDVGAPNGIALSPDEKTLYVTDVYAGRKLWLAFDLKPDGSLGRERVIHDAKPWMQQRAGDPDGLEVDRDGNLYGAGPGGVYVFAPDNTLLGVIETGVATSNLAWGDDGRTLYITASTRVFRLRTHALGARFTTYPSRTTNRTNAS